MPGGPDHGDHRAVAVDGAIQQALDGGQFPSPPDQIRLQQRPRGAAVGHAQQPPGAAPARRRP